MNHDLLNFYLNDGANQEGYTFDDVMSMSPASLENGHTYIQWILPTLTASKCQRRSPVLDQETIDQLLFCRTKFRPRYQQAITTMLDFWGIKYVRSQDGFSIKPLSGELVLTKKWTKKDDHNQLRIARMLESMRLLDFKSTSYNLFEALIQFAGYYQCGLSAKNIAYWYQAVSGAKLFV